MRRWLLVGLSGILMAMGSPVSYAGNTKDAALKQKLNRIIIPKVDFRRAGIEDIVEFLRQASADDDVAKGPKAKKGVNFVLNLKGRKIRPITFHARKISLADTLGIVTETLGLSYWVDGNVVMIEAKN